MSEQKNDDLKYQQYMNAKSEIISVINGLPYGMVLDIFRSIKDLLKQSSFVSIKDNKSSI